MPVQPAAPSPPFTHAHPMETPHRVLADYRQVAVDINEQGLALVQA